MSLAQRTKDRQLTMRKFSAGSRLAGVTSADSSLQNFARQRWRLQQNTQIGPALSIERLSACSASQRRCHMPFSESGHSTATSRPNLTRAVAIYTVNTQAFRVSALTNDAGTTIRSTPKDLKTER